MKKLIQYIIPIFLIIFLVNPALGFAGMTKSNPAAQLDLNNTTESDADIILRQHLIEVDAVRLQSEDRLYVSETLIFKNNGSKNFSGKLRTWVSDGAEIIKRNESGEIEKINMTTGELLGYLPILQNGNIVSWQDDIEANTIDTLYVEYLIPAETKGTLTRAKTYVKKLVYPTLINYKYVEKPGLPAFIIKVIKPQENSITFLDENKNKINPSFTSEDGNSVVNMFSSPQLKEVTVEISKSAITPASIAGYVILGLVIILVISYPLIRKRSGKIQVIEEKIRNSFKRREIEDTGEEVEEMGDEDTGEETEETPLETEAAPVEEFEGRTRDELESMKAELLSKLDELDKEYASGNLMDEEYEELRRSYEEKAERIAKMLG